MENINYQKILEKTINNIIASEQVPTLVLHSCCAPCSSYVLEYLTNYFNIILIYYNPNIYPPIEFENRVKEQENLIQSMIFKNKIEFVSFEYDPKEFYSAIKGYENEAEGGLRCRKCFELRLEKAAKFAKEKGCDFFTTTLSISPLKNSTLINNIGNELSKKYGIDYLISDFKKKNGYKRSVELSNEHGLYRQNYCGCIFSMNKSDNKDSN